MEEDLGMTEFDIVNKPKHYNSHPSGLECWDVVQHLPNEVANVIKYLWRADLKNGAEDLKKALWYLSKWDTRTHSILVKGSYGEYSANSDAIAALLEWYESESDSEYLDSLLILACYTVSCAIHQLIGVRGFLKKVEELETLIEKSL